MPEQGVIVEPSIVIAIIGGVVSVLLALATNLLGFRLQRDRLRQELRTEFMAEAALRQLLEHRDWNLRSFDTIRRYVGGFEDDELRRLLVRAGALRFPRDPEAVEFWGLRERCTDLLDAPPQSATDR